MTQEQIWKWLRTYGIVVFVIVLGLAAYSIFWPNTAPVSPEEQQRLDDLNQQGTR
jgi:uncharacterized protein YpmB